MTKESFELVHDFSDMMREQKIASTSIGPSGEACLLLIAPEDEAIAFGRQEQKGFASFPLSVAKNSFRATFLRFNGTLVQQTRITAMQQAFPTAHPLPDDKILVVGSRCHFRNGTPENNATVFDRAGNLVRQFVLGDGIQDVQTTNNGLIWVSYFDEGVFGNFGWTKPIGAPGIVCFDTSGRKVWDFEPPHSFNAMADCYAMNVADDAAWACYYTDFPIVRIDAQHNVRAWPNEFSGAHAIAVDARRVALWGGYNEHRCRCVVQEFGEHSLRNAREISLDLPKGIDPKCVHVIGRGNALHLFDRSRWYTWKLQ